MGTDSSQRDGFAPAAPGDSLDEERALARVAARLFGEQTAAPTVGRYYLLQQIGQGGMGVVYSAYDPVLERKVALKLLRNRDEAGPQLIEEGRALANLDHPNIVTVHEVGECDRGTFLAMAFIKGKTLSTWLSEGVESWRSRLVCLLAAARGLAAAHQAGVIHRDFKPSNVIVGDDGSVRIVDFGLAVRQVTEAPSARSQRRVGTRGYMAPEQLTGGTVGATADQYAFCVVLAETLLRRRLRDDETPDPARWHDESRLANQSISGTDAPPARLFETLARGLAKQPAERFPDMEELIAAIEAHTDSKKTPSRRRRVLPLAAALSLIGIVALGLGSRWGRQASDPCLAVDNEMARGWNSERRLRIVERQLPGRSSTELPPAWEQSLSALDEYARAWSNARESSCRAYHSGGESAELFDARTECLTRLRRRVDELGQSLETNQLSDGISVYRVVRDLLPVSTCQEPASLFLLSLRPASEPDRQAASALIERMEDARQKRTLGLTPDPDLTAELYAIVDTVEDLGARAEVRRYLASYAKTLAEELQLNRAALTDAIAIRDSRLIATCYLAIGQVLSRLGRFEDSAANLDLADATLTSLDAYADVYPPIVDLNAPRRGAILATRANLARAMGDPEAAARYADRAVNSYLSMKKPEPMRVAAMLNNAGESNRLLARFEPAIDAYTRAIELTATITGPRANQLLVLYNNRGSAYMDMGELGKAVTDLERARGNGQSVRDYGELLAASNLAMINWLRGRQQPALSGCEQARSALSTGALPEQPLWLAWLDVECEAYRVGIAGQQADLALLNERIEQLRRVGATEKTFLGLGLLRHASVMIDHRQIAAAARSLDEAAAALKVPGPNEKVEMAELYNLRGRLAAIRGDATEAQRHYRKALASLERKGLTGHPILVESLIEIALAQPNAAEAEELLARAAQIVAAQELSPRWQARINEAQSARARALQ